MHAARSKLDLQIQKTKLADSYHALLDEFSSTELRTVGNYTLGRLIGKGSFGKVYLASHKLTNGSKVVLKSAKKDDANLAREIHHHRQFLHPHIARLYEVIVTEKLVWLVLEYCPGDELYNYLLRNGALPVEKVQKIFTQLVGAVSYVHNLSCVHRDLKLENILLDKSENVKLCDFGFTREYEGKANYLQTFCGTICYSAPEMLRGEKYAGEKVDVWSLGVILYALLTGELPFDDDDDLATKHKILSVEPEYPESVPTEAKTLIVKLLSKRPLIRPSLADILTDPFLAPYAPLQQAILKVTRPAPFATPLEKDTLQRMRSAGVDIDKVIEHVLSQRCDPLAGWWALLIEKEERKERRKERKKKEKEMEAKSLRRISATSSRRTPTLHDVDEELPGSVVESLRSRGRRERRSFPNPQLNIPELPKLPEGTVVQSPDGTKPLLPPQKDRIRSTRSVSSTRYRPPVPPKERDRRRSRSSTLHLVSANPELLAPPGGVQKRRVPKRHQLAILNQLASIKQWFIESAKRAKSPNVRGEPNAMSTGRSTSPNDTRESTVQLDTKRPSSSLLTPTMQHRSNLQTPKTSYRNKRTSLSPAPLTPLSSYRRSSAGLRGRKSTSSSVSSIRSLHHVHTHSRATSTSSTSNSIKSSAIHSRVPSVARSPHASVKVLPAMPNNVTLPSNIRVVRTTPAPVNTSATRYNERASFGPLGSPSLVFAKRKKTPFRGPMLHITPTPGTSSRVTGSNPGSRSNSLPRRRSRLIIEEEDEDEDEIEEVDAFSPVEREAEVTLLDSSGSPLEKE